MTQFLPKCLEDYLSVDDWVEEYDAPLHGYLRVVRRSLCGSIETVFGLVTHTIYRYQYDQLAWLMDYIALGYRQEEKQLRRLVDAIFWTGSARGLYLLDVAMHRIGDIAWFDRVGWAALVARHLKAWRSTSLLRYLRYGHMSVRGIECRVYLGEVLMKVHPREIPYEFAVLICTTLNVKPLSISSLIILFDPHDSRLLEAVVRLFLMSTRVTYRLSPVDLPSWAKGEQDLARKNLEDLVWYYRVGTKETPDIRRRAYEVLVRHGLIDHLEI